MVFALSIGLLIDLRFVVENLGIVAILLLIVLLAKSAMNVGVLRLLGEPWPRAFLTGTVLAQVGEFSFVLAAAGAAMGLIDDTGSRLAVAVIALSLMVSPFWLDAARRLHRLARTGVTGGEEILRELYGEEAESIIARSNHLARTLLYLGYKFAPRRFRARAALRGAAVEPVPPGPVIEAEYVETSAAKAGADDPPAAPRPAPRRRRATARRKSGPAKTNGAPPPAGEA
jgi:CPA2 family monovalent cation:H+ antiporter-2